MTNWLQSVSLSIDILQPVCQLVAMTQAAPPDKQETILDAAFQAFATYGYRRTSMEDIAQGAGVSRTALYLHYRNKEDIFRSLAQHYFAQTLLDMQAALNLPGLDAKQALYGCFVAKDGKFMDVVLSTPHGAELLDAGFSISGDLAKMAEGQVADMLATWLGDKGLPPDLGPAHDFAETVVAALNGLKSSVKSLKALRAGEARLAGLIAKSLSART
jgi:AcrR family transcriptional regulator